MNSSYDIPALLTGMVAGLGAHLAHDSHEQPLMVGIRTGGVWIAKRLHQGIGMKEPLGELNINFYRDDFTRIGLHPQVQPSSLPFGIDDRHIVLVDDVLYTGRTIRAALNEIFDYGRPASVTLAVLVNRSGRELPIQADIVGTTIDPGPGEHIKLTGPAPLSLEVQRFR
ncbi:MAG: bifunctional pyr operon transcriptional regulator/uracil phosphoribosyltransferase PyrR [Gammaproteobacteria bacterium]|nr:bifunctional pyr operon transcriptional regulator/uracil phosphoribosyltransferase PyrR [Gammaproteobacteria bacterium]